MAIAVVLTTQQDISLIHWAARIASARQQGLILIWAQQRRGASKRTTSRLIPELPRELQPTCELLDRGEFRLIADALMKADDSDSETNAEAGPQLPLEVICLSSAQVHIDVEVEIDELDISCLVLTRNCKDRSPSELHEHLLHAVDCEIVVLLHGETETSQCRRIVTPMGEGPHSASCLRMAKDLVKDSDASVVALHVEPQMADVAPQVAKRFLDRNVQRALGSKQDSIEKQVVISDDIISGIRESVDAAPTDLIILGMKRQVIVRRFSSQGVAERLAAANPGPTIAVLQSAMPLTSQIGRWTNELLRGTVPQLPREERVVLVDRIQSSSRWNFDFIMLICMSTLIAAGGLIQDSPAVVIGAMLVAPLMTPLLGTGLALVQGNSILFRSTLLTVLKGFVLAFFISWLIGWLVPGIEMTSEMQKRCIPSVLDIVVAAVGGIAAAYASGRPNLLSALPGVAIAASLVPPIATSGLVAGQLMDFNSSIGAALLFFTNIVAIILGTVIAFLAVGIRSTHQHSEFNRWTLVASSVLLAITLALGVYESWPHRPQAVDARQDAQVQLDALAAQDTWKCSDIRLTEEQGNKTAVVSIDSRIALSEKRLEAIRETVEAAVQNAVVKIAVTYQK